MLAPLFNEMSITELGDRYRKVKTGVQLKFSEILASRVKNALHYKPEQKDFYSLSEMLQVQDQRNNDFPLLLQVENKETIEQKKKDNDEILEEIQRIKRC